MQLVHLHHAGLQPYEWRIETVAGSASRIDRDWDSGTKDAVTDPPF